MLKRVILLILSLTILITFFSCGREEGEGEYLTFSDSLGNKVSLDEKPSRVAVLFSSLAEAWTLAGVLTKVPDEQLSTLFEGRAFAKVTYADGTTNRLPHDREF